MSNESVEPEPLQRSERRTWVQSALVGAAFAVPLHVWMLTAGTWNLFRWSRQSDLYDAQARSLLDGTFAMDQRVLGIESFGRGDQTFMYFGPVPALLRLPVVAFTRTFDGRLAAVSMLLALLVATWALIGLGWRIRTCVLTDREPAALEVSRFESAAVSLTFFAMLGGSSLLYASSRTWVYHEAILWGVALTFASLGALLAWLDTERRQYLVGASALATLALLTRPSVGGAAIAAIGLVGAREILLPLIAARRDQRGDALAVAAAQWRRSAVFVSVTAIPVVAYSIINWIKFRRLFGVPFDQQGFTLLNERRRDMLAANGGTLFNVDFIPTNLFTYLRPDLIDVDGAFPYLQPVRPSATIGSPFFDLIDFTSGVPSTMPVLLVLAIIGVATVARGRNGNARAIWPLLAGCSLGTVAVLAIGYLANRYQSDFLPLLAVATLVGLPIAVQWIEARSGRRARIGSVIVAVVLVATGTVTNLAFGYSYQRVLSPSVHPDSVAGFVANQQRVDGWFGDGRLDDIRRVDGLPQDSEVGDIAIVGECEALYVSDGVVSDDGALTHWRLAELSARAGHRRGTLSVRPGDESSIALLDLVPGPPASPISLTLDVDERRRVMVVVATSQDGSTRGPDLPLRTGDDVRWEAFADPFVGKFEIYLGGRLASFGALPVGDLMQVTLGADATVEEISGRLCESL